MSDLLKIIFIVSLVLILVSSGIALAASNTIPSSGVDSKVIPVDAGDVKPQECSAVNLTNLVQGAGTITGSDANDLIFGSSGDDTIFGLGGDDCILGGSGDDIIDGGDQVDVCLGGPGSNTLSNCE